MKKNIKQQGRNKIEVDKIWFEDMHVKLKCKQVKLWFSSIKLSLIFIQIQITQSATRKFNSYQEQKKEEGESKVTKTSTMVKMSVQYWNGIK